MNRKLSKIFLLTFGLIGLVFLSLGLGFLWYYTHQTADMVTMSGYITGFDSDGDPLVVYIVDGESYTVEGGISSTNQHVGDEYKLFIDPDDPTRAMDSTFLVMGIVFTAMGAVFALAGIITAVALGSAARSREALLGYGRRVIATVLSVDVNRSVNLGKVHPLRVTAECTHPLTGTTVHIRSHNILSTNLQPGDRVEVAFHPSNEKKYAFDLPEEANT